MLFNFEYRTNGLAYVTVFSHQQQTGGFCLPHTAAQEFQDALEKAGIPHGEWSGQNQEPKA